MVLESSNYAMKRNEWGYSGVFFALQTVRELALDYLLPNVSMSQTCATSIRTPLRRATLLRGCRLQAVADGHFEDERDDLPVSVLSIDAAG